MKVRDLRLVPLALLTWIAVACARLSLSWALSVLALLMIGAAVGVIAGLRHSPRPTAWATGLVLAALISSFAVTHMVILHQRTHHAQWPQAVTTTAEVCINGTVATASQPTSQSTPDQPRWYTDLVVDTLTVMIIHDAPLERGDRITACGTTREAPRTSHRVALLDTHTITTHAHPTGPTAWSNTVRRHTMDLAATLEPQAQGLVPGTAIGDTTLMPPHLDDAMKATSLTHITAVSGSHFSLVFLMVLTLAAPLPRWAKAIVASVAMALFVILVHPQPSVLRAATMAAIAVLAIIVRRPPQGLTSLSWAVILLVTANPYLATHLGFVLSVAATAGLVVGTTPIATALHRPSQPRRWMPEPLAYALAVPTAAWMACTPILIILDPSISVISVLANTLAAPALAPATIISLLGALIAPWAPPVALALFHVASIATSWISYVAVTCAQLPFARLPWWEGPQGVCAAALAMLAFASVLSLFHPDARAWWGTTIHSVQRRTIMQVAALITTARDARFFPPRGSAPTITPPAVLRRCALILLCTLVIVVIRPTWLTYWWPTTDQWTLIACDVGQGDAFLVKDPTGHIIMVDVGPPNSGITRCLNKAGVARIDTLIISHAHADHQGALPEVLNAVDVGAVHVSQRYSDDSDDRALLDQHTGGRTRIISHSAGERVLLSPTTTMNILWPMPPARVSASSRDSDPRNNDSLVVQLTVTGPNEPLTLTFLGDLEEDAQDKLAHTLISQQDPSPPGWHIVKLAHHGSRSQSEMLARVLAPDLVVVGVGAHNTYGHPHADALDLYRGAAIMRTDICHTFDVSVTRGVLASHMCSPQKER